MPLDVLLMNPNTRDRPMPWWERLAGRAPHPGLAQLVACLEEAGHSVRILDAEAEDLPPDGVFERLKSFGDVRFAGITTTTSTFPAARALAGIVRRALPNAVLVAGGVHATVCPDEPLQDGGFDLVVRGEGEITLVELAAGGDPQTMLGVSWVKDGLVVHNDERPLIDSLDSLPTPAYHRFALHRYRPGPGSYRRLPSLPMVSSRGCPGHCVYCYVSFGHKLRQRSATRLVEDVVLQRERHGIRQIQFFDDTFTMRRDHVAAFCAGMRAADLDIKWSCYARVDAVDPEILAAMAAAGCHQVCFGIETGTERMMGEIGKKVSLDQVATAVRLARAAGIQPRGSFLFGNRGETMESMQGTLDYALSLPLDLALFNVVTPYPGTELFAWAQSEGRLLSSDWSRYNRSNALMRLDGLSPRSIEAMHNRAYVRFYGRPRWLLKRSWRVLPWRAALDAVRTSP